MDELWSGVQEVIADTALLLGCVAAAALLRDRAALMAEQCAHAARAAAAWKRLERSLCGGTTRRCVQATRSR